MPNNIREMATETRIKVENGTLDPTDRRILALLQDNAKMSQADMAKEVGLTAPSVNERIRKLERGGFIRGYVTLLDERKLGHDITAFVEIFIEHPKFESSFIEAVGDLDEVLECHHITGEFSLLLKVRVRDMRARGLAIGTAAHGIGTARALSVSAAAGAFSGLAMGLNALASALMLPLLWRLFVG